MEKVRLGVIGIGNQGSGYVTKIQRGDVPEMEIAAVCDISPDRLEWAEKNHPDVARFDDAEKMMDSGLVDAVSCMLYLEILEETEEFLDFSQKTRVLEQFRVEEPELPLEDYLMHSPELGVPAESIYLEEEETEPEQENVDYKWANVHHVYRDLTATYLFITKERGFILPHQCIEEGDDALWALLRKKIPEERRTDLRK